jgi:hypothetical protein
MTIGLRERIERSYVLNEEDLRTEQVRVTSGRKAESNGKS